MMTFGQPSRPTGTVVAFTHDHQYVEVGARQNPNGTWNSLWGCTRCPDLFVGGNVGPIPGGWCPCGWVSKPDARRCEECQGPLMEETITWTGRNTAEVKRWVNEQSCGLGEQTWFVTRSMTASTGNQAWKYVRGDKGWPDTVRAAVYNPSTDWLPLERGDMIQWDGRRFRVLKGVIKEG